MSNRQNARLYSGSSHGGGYNPSDRGGGPGLIPQLLGTDKVKGGPTVDSSGNVQPGLYTGSKGFMSGWSQRHAAELNSGLNEQAMEGKLSAQQAAQEQQRMKLEKSLENSLKNSEQMRAIATKLGIPADELAGTLSKELANNALQETQNTGKALKDPAVQASYPTQLIAQNQAQDAINRNKLQLQTGTGGVATMPGPIGSKGNTTIKGALPTQETQLVGTGPVDPRTGQPMMTTPVTKQSFVPGTASFPISPQTMQGAQGIGTGGQQPTQLPSPQDEGGPADKTTPQSTGPSLADYFKQGQANATPDNNPFLLQSGQTDPSVLNQTPNGQSAGDANQATAWQALMQQFLNSVQAQ